MEATVRFKGWTPSPRAVVVGMERDNKVFTLRFEGLPAYPGGTAYLHIDFGSAGADSIEIVDAGLRRSRETLHSTRASRPPMSKSLQTTTLFGTPIGCLST